MNTLPENNNLPANEMTLRDYFAAKAMQGLMSCEAWNESVRREDIALESYSVADAMLSMRNQEP